MKNRNIVGAMMGASVSVLVLLSACSESLRAGIEVTPEAGPVFTTADAGAVETPSDVGYCPAYECPAPYATCKDKSGLCTTNLDSDVDHCGACDKKCPAESGELRAYFICATGRCEMLCRQNAADCNHLVDDGCEASLDSDPSNCGACGQACAAGEVCWQGACGCPAGYTRCGNQCARLTDDSQNCGACGNSCDTAPSEQVDWVCGEGVFPDGTMLACVNSKCQPKCMTGSTDCNGDLCTDGCEIRTADDAQNCGTCGSSCKDGQACVDGRCLCDTPDMTLCSSQCVDLQSDAHNCGACGNACPGFQDMLIGGISPSGSPVCLMGRCSFSCAPGYADCDGRLDNGCEVDLNSDAINCGACGAKCDVAGGQPCIGGKCLTQPCDAGAVK